VTTSLPLTELQTALASAALLIAPLAGAGLALINTGLGRSRNAAHAMISALCAASTAALVYFVVGRCWHASAAEPARILILGGKPWNWLGKGAPFFAGLPAEGSPAFLNAWIGLIGAALVALIPIGAGGERWRLSSICASTALLTGITFPLFAHWSQGGGWLSQLGTNYGLGAGFVDAGGTGLIHVTGGFTALAIAWILGPRRGKYGQDGMPMAIPGHGVVFVLFGCFAAAVGWLGLNVAGAILFAGAAPGRLALIGVDTLLGACSAAVTAAIVTRVRFGRPDASLSANGWVGGLVATSAGCAFLPPAAAVLTGLIAGALVTFSVELLELRLEIDDPGGSISVHAVAGMWGLLAAGLLGRFPGVGEGTELAQVVGIATLVGFVFPLTWGLNAMLNRFAPMRVSREGERQGMDLFELGAGAYPDFVTHADDYMQR
jgi:Amt family ammonium transporter